MEPRFRLVFRQAQTVLFVSCIAATASVMAADPPVSSSLNESSRRLSAAQTEAGRSSEISARIRKMTWQLLVGELAGDRRAGLSSGSFDELTSGLKDLNQLLAEMKDQPQLERDLTKHVQLTMRFDATLARRAGLEKQRDVSRADELQRLKQLREINRAYRDLVQSLMRLQTSQALGQSTEVATFGDTVTKLFAGIETVVGQRRDFYLFQDEPALGSEENGELKLVQELAQPLATDVRHHQLALQAYTLAKLAQPTTPASREKLELAKTLAEAALDQSSDPHVLGHWALAIACRELGRLETIDDPWNPSAHERAAELFDRARQELATAKTHVPNDAGQAAWVVELDRQLAELTSPTAALQHALGRLSAGFAGEAVALVERCATLHRTSDVAAGLYDCRRLGGATLPELDSLAERLWASQLWTDQDETARLYRGRQGVLGLWTQLSDERLAERGEDWRRAFSTRLESSLSDLATAAKSENPQVRRIAECHRGLAAAMQLLLAPAANTEFAQKQLAIVPMAVAELEHDLDLAPPFEQLTRREAAIAGRLAQGYLALRLLPEHQSIALPAFSSALNAIALIPNGLSMPRLLGTPVLQSLSGRADGADARLAQEEQQLRRSLQRLLPAVAALRLAPSAEAATHLSAIARDLEAPIASLDPRSALDPRDSGDGRKAAISEVRTAAVLAFLGAIEPASAVCEALSPWRPGLKPADLNSLDMKSLREELLIVSDPIRMTVVALAFEDYGASLSSTGTDNSRQLAWLSLARELQQSARNQFADSSILPKSHPAEAEMNRQAVQRLNEPEFYLSRSRTLVSELRINEARQLLDAGLRRHPDSIPLRETLVQTLIDEADLRPSESVELIARAIAQLQALTADPTPETSESQLKLAGLLERTKKNVQARTLYRRVAEQTTDPRQQLRARLRLAVLQVSTDAP